MGSVDRSGFGPLYLETIDRVYEAASAHLLARFPGSTPEDEAKRQGNLRKRLFAIAHPGKVDFDTLYDLVVSSYDAATNTVTGERMRRMCPSNRGGCN